MQDVTDLPFMRVLSRRSLPDWFVTEYFRVHVDSKPNRYILRSILENETGRPIFAQMIGRDISELVRTARELSEFPVAGIDLNLGCPAPIVCRKDAGGGLLRNPEKIREILTALRDAIPGKFTVKTRLGYHHADEFSALLEIFGASGIDGLTIHGRTVADRYQTPVHPDFVKLAVQIMPCPVIANGNIVDVETAVAYHGKTRAHGLMIGRGAIRNPWLFGQIEAGFLGKEPPAPTHRDLLGYIHELSTEIARETKSFRPLAHIQRMKKTLIYICDGLGPELENGIRRMKTAEEFEQLIRSHLDHNTPLPARPGLESRLFCGFSNLVNP